MSYVSHWPNQSRLSDVGCRLGNHSSTFLAIVDGCLNPRPPTCHMYSTPSQQLNKHFACLSLNNYPCHTPACLRYPSITIHWCAPSTSTYSRIHGLTVLIKCNGIRGFIFLALCARAARHPNPEVPPDRVKSRTVLNSTPQFLSQTLSRLRISLSCNLLPQMSDNTDSDPLEFPGSDPTEPSLPALPSDDSLDELLLKPHTMENIMNGML